MKRWIILLLIALLSLTAQAQSVEEKIAKAKEVKEEFRQFLDTLPPGSVPFKNFLKNCVAAALEGGQIREQAEALVEDEKLKFRLIVIEPIETFTELPKLSGGFGSNVAHYLPKERLLVWVDFPYTSQWRPVAVGTQVFKAWSDLAGASASASPLNMAEYSRVNYQFIFDMVEKASGGRFGDKLVLTKGERLTSKDLFGQVIASNFWSLAKGDEEDLNEVFPEPPASPDERGVRQITYIMLLNMSKNRLLRF